MKGLSSVAKSANLYVRIEPEIKDQAEDILSSLGLSASNAINLFYKQIILQRGLPFAVKLPAAHVPDMGKMTAAQINAEIEKGYADMLAGRVKPAEQAFAEIRGDMRE